MRYPQRRGSPFMEPAGLRGSGPDNALWFWGVSGAEYAQRADLWPLNPAGDLIALMMIEQLQYRLSPEAEVAFKEYIEKRRLRPHFANARSMRNAIDRARLRQASRLLAQGGTVTREDLVTIDIADIRASRVFTDASAEST